MARILVIDDEPLICEMLHEVLTAAGHEVSVAPDGRKAVRLTQRRSVDLVVTDIIMPEKDGLAVIEELRGVQPDAKIIAISGGSRIREADVLKWAAELGATHTFQKPIEWPDLLAAVEDCLKDKKRVPVKA